ncbi:MAG: peptide chain release factor N(5)-glutamine methyltransferase [Nitrospirota bacterium]
MRALEKLREATEFLKKCDIEDASREAEIIITHCLGIGRAAFFRDNPRIHKEELGKIDEFMERRSKREPLQYILGYVDFYGLKIKIGEGVLIPRPETELLVEEAIKIISNFEFRISNFKILDLCTGSGCLALALAKEFPDAQVYGIDISEVAIRYAKENAEINGIKNVTFLKGSLFESIAQLVTFDLIVSNPPYIRRDDLKNLQPEVKDWEPIEALDGGEDGLDYYRAIIPEAKSYLKEGRCLILELGFDQADAVRKIAQDANFINISLIKDYAGIERIATAKNDG